MEQLRLIANPHLLANEQYTKKRQHSLLGNGK